MPANAKTVLVVDDTEANRYSVARHLRQAGYQVWEAASGGDALRLAAQQPSLIILDVRLPDTFGYEVCRQLKANPNTGAIPILHISATYQMSADRVRSPDPGGAPRRQDAHLGRGSRHRHSQREPTEDLRPI